MNKIVITNVSRLFLIKEFVFFTFYFQTPKVTTNLIDIFEVINFDYYNSELIKYNII